jgi:hypothetical protein
MNQNEGNGMNTENTGTTNAGGSAETPATPQLEQMASVGEPSPPASHKGGRPRKSRSLPDLGADPTWVIYQCQGAPREGHVVREYREDGRADGLLVVNNGGISNIVLSASEEWRCWYRPAFVSAEQGMKPRHPLQEATVRLADATLSQNPRPRKTTQDANAAATPRDVEGPGSRREPSWVSADGATSENPTPRKRRAKDPALEPAPVAPRFSPLDWVNLEFSAENFLAAVRGKNEIEARRYLGFLQAVAKHSLADLTNA